MKNRIQILFATLFILLSVNSFAQVPIHNSLPSAPAAIFIDFDGHRVNGTPWNGNGPINAGPSGLNPQQMTEVFNRVAEDYRPFNVNITTDSTVFLSLPANRRMRVIVTVTYEWYGMAGGIAYIGSFSWADNTPAFVFSGLLGYNAKNVGEAVSHEAGHTLGLRHQSSYNGSCQKTSEYNPGVGSGQISWAPIMGESYSRNMTLWNNGANPYGCSNYQDDLGLITSTTNGFGYRADDFGSQTDNTAPAIQLTNNQFDVSGIIERISDHDVFSRTLPTFGNFHVDAVPYNIGTGNSGSNLDIQVDLVQNNSVVASYNPETLMDLTIDTMLSPGTYYLRVQGKGNVFAPEYASLGSYSLKGSFAPAVTLPLHKLELRGAAENGRHRFNWIIEADETVVSQTLESSTNGISYSSAATVSSTARSYQRTPSAGGITYYRMKVTFDDNRTYYSNTVSLRSENGAGKPFLTANMVKQSITVSSPSNFGYSILDMNGRVVSKGNLVQGMNNVNVSAVANGMYIIQYTNGGEQFSEKFMKQ